MTETGTVTTDTAFDHYRTIYYSEDLNRLAHNITLWRKGKGFVSPGDITGPIDEDYAKELTNADLMIGRVMLMVTELAEAAEAVRKNDRENFGEELADCIIRILDTCGACDIDIADILYRKMVKNEGRPYKHGKVA